jgi:hypothetical protein
MLDCGLFQLKTLLNNRNCLCMAKTSDVTYWVVLKMLKFSQNHQFSNMISSEQNN